MNRLKSLERLLRSLTTAYYFGDAVTLDVFLDSLATKDVVNCVTSFRWDSGEKVTIRAVIRLDAAEFFYSYSSPI